MGKFLTMGVSGEVDEFIQHVNASQRSLYAFILTLVSNREDAYDILQEANLVIWQKRGDFLKGTNFFAWASQIARNKVLMYRRKMHRDRLCFDDALVGKLVDETAGKPFFGDEWLSPLWQCVEKLPEDDRALLKKRYVEDCQARHIADQVGRSPGAIAQALYRIRLTLMRCIDATLSSREKG
jgi:RNA polymerase sigma-70 factor, ECF subfamily